MTDLIRDIFALDGERIVIDAVVIAPSGRASLQLVFDTGAVLTTLASTVAQAIGIAWLERSRSGRRERTLEVGDGAVAGGDVPLVRQPGFHDAAEVERGGVLDAGDIAGADRPPLAPVVAQRAALVGEQRPERRDRVRAELEEAEAERPGVVVLVEEAPRVGEAGGVLGQRAGVELGDLALAALPHRRGVALEQHLAGHQPGLE